MGHEQHPPGRKAIRDLVEAERLLFQICDYLEYLERDKEYHFGELVEITGGGAGVTIRARHMLGRVPDSFQIAWKDATGDVWVSAADPAWTDKMVYFRATNLVNFRVRIYVQETYQ